MKTEKSAGVVIFNKNKFLLLKYKRYWGFVKGNIESNETEKETAIRETEEETKIKDLQFIDFKEKLNYIYKWDNSLISKEVIMFLAKTNTESVTISEEHLDYKWLEYEQALEYLKFDNLKNLLIKVNEIIKEL